MLAAHLSLNYLGQLLGSATSRALPIPKELGGVTPEGTCQDYVAALVLWKGLTGDPGFPDSGRIVEPYAQHG